MVDLSTHKIKVIPGINDIPREATEGRAGNGSELISKHNSLIAELSNVVSSISNTSNRDGFQLHPEYLEIYVSQSTGSDNTGIGSSEKPYKTINKALNFIKTKYILTEAYIYLVDGNFSEPIDFKGIYGFNSDLTETPTLFFSLEGDGVIVNHSKETPFIFPTHKGVVVSLDTSGTDAKINLVDHLFIFDSFVKINCQLSYVSANLYASLIIALESKVILDSFGVDGNPCSNLLYATNNSLIILESTASAGNLRNYPSNSALFEITNNSRLILEQDILLEGLTAAIRLKNGGFLYQQGRNVLSPIEDNKIATAVYTHSRVFSPNIQVLNFNFETLEDKTYTLVNYLPYNARIIKVAWSLNSGSFNIAINVRGDKTVPLQDNLVEGFIVKTQEILSASNPQALEEFRFTMTVSNANAPIGFSLTLILQIG